jgi:vacuolar-type H+-ATPase subunit I/STV1
VVRTIGYINICQYGDAYRTLSVLEKDYRPWNESVLAYLSRVQRTPEDHYQLMKTYLRGKSSESVEGLPPQVLREVARRKDFLNQQEALNNREDEIQRYPAVDEEIRNQKGKLKARMDLAKNRLAQLRVNLEKAKTDKTLIRYIDQWKGETRLESDVISGYKYLLALYEDGRMGVERLRIQADHHIDTEKEQLRTQAGKLVIAHFKSVESDLAKILDNNEFLRYEVFAGSGENIRYQVAGGNVGKKGGRVPASARPEKSLHWDFDGEYWQDEIGNYRSSLKDNCPTKGPAGPTKNGQARLGGGE